MSDPGPGVEHLPGQCSSCRHGTVQQRRHKGSFSHIRARAHQRGAASASGLVRDRRSRCVPDNLGMFPSVRKQAARYVQVTRSFHPCRAGRTCARLVRPSSSSPLFLLLTTRFSVSAPFSLQTKRSNGRRSRHRLTAARRGGPRRPLRSVALDARCTALLGLARWSSRRAQAARSSSRVSFDPGGGRERPRRARASDRLLCEEGRG